MGEGLLSTGPAALLGAGREPGRKERERGRGSRPDCASLSRVRNLYSTPETDITAVRGKEVGVGRGVWRGEVFVEESAAGEQSSGTQVTGTAGSPSSGSSQQQPRPGDRGGGGRGAEGRTLKGGGRAKGTPEPCRHQRPSIWHQGSSDPAEGSATGEVSPQGRQGALRLLPIRTPAPNPAASTTTALLRPLSPPPARILAPASTLPSRSGPH